MSPMIYTLVFVLACTDKSDTTTDATSSTQAPTTSTADTTETDPTDTTTTTDTTDPTTTDTTTDPTDTTNTEFWSPPPGTSWQWQLTGTIDTSLDVTMYDIDLFDVPTTTLTTLRSDDRIIICYFSAGSFEDWRTDADDFPTEAIGNPLGDWEGEWWIDHTHPTVRDIMTARLEYAAIRGCHGVEPDNVDGYANNNGLGLTAADQLDYNRFLADTAHALGLSIGLKNDLDQLEDLVDHFDWALNEECAAYNECNRLTVFTDNNKAAFHVEYVDRWNQAEDKADDICGNAPHLDTLIKTWDLGSEYLACP